MIYTSVKSAFFTYSFVLNSVADVTSLKKIESTETWLEWKTDVQNSTVQWLCRKVDYREVATSFLVSLCTFILIRPPGTGRPYVLLLFIIFFFKVRSPRSVGRSPRKFAIWSETCSIYKCRSKNLGGAPKKFWGQKHANFGPISYPFSIWAWMSPERIKTKLVRGETVLCTLR